MSKDIREWSVELWGSLPNMRNDLYTSEQFAEEEDAQEAFDNPKGTFLAVDIPDAAWFRLTGPDGECQIRKNSDYMPDTDGSEDEWQKELAREHGMLHGVEAMNDFNGESTMDADEHARQNWNSQDDY